jgi:peptidoglycan-associated lipoprotein
MLLKTKLTLAVMALALGFGGYGCSDDEPKTEEPVQPAATPEPAPTPEPAVSSFAPETVYFAFDDYTLNGDAKTRLESLAEHLKGSQTTVVQIEGHCDERGSIEYNLALGERRAQSVKNFLVQLGIDASRLSTISYGEEKPAVTGSSESSWAKNRRAEFVLTTN